MPLAKLKELLDTQHIKYTTINHSAAFTAPETAQSAHIAGKAMAKTVIVKFDGEMKMVVVPANLKIDLEALKTLVKAHKVELASEYEFTNRFPNCELGAMPPIGSLFGIDVYMDQSLTKNKEIAFNAGTHTELIKLSLKDYVNTTHPKLIRMCTS